MKKLLIAVAMFVALALFAGCATTGPYTPPAVCGESADSLILSKFPDPRNLDRALLGVQFVALEKLKNYDKNDAIAVLDGIASALDDNQTYADVVALIQSKLKIANERVGAVIFVLGPDISILAEPLPISECDRILVKKHLDKQKALITIYSVE